MGRMNITGSIRARLTDVRKRGKAFAQGLGVRADIAVIRRRLRKAFAELGERAYEEMAAGRAKGWEDVPSLAEFRTRIEGLNVEIHQREQKLTEIATEGEQVVVETKPEETAAEGDSASPKEVASSKPAK